MKPESTSENQRVIDNLQAAVDGLESDARRIEKPIEGLWEQKMDAFREMDRLHHALLYVYSEELETRKAEAKTRHRKLKSRISDLESEAAPLWAAAHQLRKEIKQRQRKEWWANLGRALTGWIAQNRHHMTTPELRQAGEGTLYPNRWFVCVIKETQEEANKFLAENEGWGLLNKVPDGFALARMGDEGLTKTFFAVTSDGDFFGAINPVQPQDMQVLRTRRDGHTGMGLYPVAFSKGLRLATRADFETYRISMDGYKDDPEHYLTPSK